MLCINNCDRSAVRKEFKYPAKLLDKYHGLWYNVIEERRS